MAIGQEKNTGDSLSIIRLGYSICSSNWPIIHGEYVYVYIWKQLKLLNPNRSLHSLDTKTWLQAAQDHLEMSCAPSAMDKLCVKQLVSLVFHNILFIIFFLSSEFNIVQDNVTMFEPLPTSVACYEAAGQLQPARGPSQRNMPSESLIKVPSQGLPKWLRVSP